MHWAEFGEEEVLYSNQIKLAQKWHNPTRSTMKADFDQSISQSAQLLAAIKEYDANKWKAIGAKVGKPAKVRTIKGREGSTYCHPIIL